jgi:DtxR family Mn-dependent transcriptional regulator
MWEVFLSKTLGFDWNEVHEIAEQLEHVRSETLVEKLDEFLGFPKFDPHGDPIPSVDLLMPDYEGHPLTRVRAGQHCRLVSVTDDSSEILSQLDALNFRLESEMDVLGPGAPEGSIVVRHNGKVSLIREDLAKRLYVI